MNVQTLSPEEWDFSKLDDASTDELTRCQAYEYARESPVLRGLSTSAKGLGMHGLLFGEEVSLSDERSSWLRAFNERVGTDFFRPKLVMFSIFCEEFPETPWLAMPDSQKKLLRTLSRSSRPLRLAALDEIALLKTEGENEQLNIFSKFEEPPSEETQKMVTTPTHSSSRGGLVFGVSMNLHDSRDCDIVDQFGKLLAELRADVGISEPTDREVGRTSRKGRGTAHHDVRESLFKLGVMRILNRCRFEDVWQNCPGAWDLWKTRDEALSHLPDGVKCDAYTRREIVTLSRKSVVSTFRALFPFESSDPIHYKLKRKS